MGSWVACTPDPIRHSNSEVKQADLSEISSIIEVEGRWRRFLKFNLVFLYLLILPKFYQELAGTELKLILQNQSGIYLFNIEY